MLMQTYKLTVAYDGTDFQGWQVQPHGQTVADRLQKRFYELFGERITLLGASRTDAGVHALDQVARLRAAVNVSPQQMKQAWNNSLGDSILIRSIEEVPESFHPHKNVREKTYYYNLFLKHPIPMMARYGWMYPFIDEVDLAVLEQALQLYVGEHDFRSFCKLEEDRTTVRTITGVSLRELKRYNMLQVAISGPGFLRFQIRRMIGYALDVARRDDLSLDYLQDLLDNPHPEQTLTRADGKGLILRKILYSNEEV